MLLPSQLEAALTEEGLKVWYYESALVLGRNDWERDIRTAINYARAALILVGPEGYGPYQEREVDACFIECAQRKESNEGELPIIPVILPDAHIPDERLKNLTHVDVGLDKADPLFRPQVVKRLKLGITGKQD